MNNEEAKTYWANIRTRQELIGNNLMEVCCDYPDQIRPIIDELVSYLNDNQLTEIPYEIGDLLNLERLQLHNNSL